MLPYLQRALHHGFSALRRAVCQLGLIEVAERVIADVVLVNVALVLALGARFLVLFWLDSSSGNPLAFYQHLLRESVAAYGVSGPLLSALCLSAFAASGFYTFGRAYRGRYKAFIVLQAVTMAYLAFGAVMYLLLPSAALFPRSAWPVAWLVTLALVGGVRLWAMLWRRTVWAEARIWGRPERRSVRNILVIGAAGYIGSVLTRKLLDRGYRVTALDALLYGDDSIKALYGRGDFDLVHGDLRDIEAVTRALQYADAVVHLGALVGDPACGLDERLTLEINLAATRMIAEAARGFGIQRFVFASTCSVYGASSETLDECSALNPVSLYARSKVESERLLLGMDGDHFAPTILRFATIYGLSPRPRFDLVVNLLAARAAAEGRITILGGEQWRPFVHVDDVADALLACLQAPLGVVKGQTFNVGADEQNHRIAELGEIIAGLVPGVEIVRQGEDADLRNYRVSFARIRTRLGFVPRHTVAEGILEIAAAVRDGRIADYREARYSNYRTLSEGNGELLIRRTQMTPLYADSLEPLTVPPGVAPGAAR